MLTPRTADQPTQSGIGTYQHRKRDERREGRGAEHSVLRFLIVRVLRMVDVDERLGIPIEHRKPRALDLNHHPVPLEKRMVFVAERELKLRLFAWHHRLRLAHAVPELRAQDV